MSTSSTLGPTPVTSQEPLIAIISGSMGRKVSPKFCVYYARYRICWRPLNRGEVPELNLAASFDRYTSWLGVHTVFFVGEKAPRIPILLSSSPYSAASNLLILPSLSQGISDSCCVTLTACSNGCPYISSRTPWRLVGVSDETPVHLLCGPVVRVDALQLADVRELQGTH